MRLSLLALGFITIFTTSTLLSTHLKAQNGVKVVPIGESIKPESSSTGKKSTKRRRYQTPIVKEGTEFLIALGTAVSSGLSKEGDIITLYAAENVGKSSRMPGIVKGAVGRGVVSLVDNKEEKLNIRLESITAYDGKSVPISGNIELSGDKKNTANAPYGSRFTARLGEKIVVRSRPKKGAEPKALMAFVELDGRKARADLVKGKSKGQVKMILEAPKGYTAEAITTETVALSEVNGAPLALPIKPMARSPKLGDENKNGTMDVTFWFDAWDFIKNQPEQSNTIVITGKMEDGKLFRAISRVTIDY